jgi:hypothetical protein
MKRFYPSALVAALVFFSSPTMAQFECWCAFIQDYTVLQQTNKQVKVSWKADTELGTAKDFVIQRCYTGLIADMVDIGWVSANPGASLTSYIFYDAYPCNGAATHAYYRIKSVNTNNDLRYTTIEVVNLNGCPSGCSSPNSPQTCRCALNQLTGPSTICSGTAVYEVTNASGPVSWSVSNGSVASISATSSTRATVTKTGDGEVTVTAAISGCSNLTKVVTLGTATPTSLSEYNKSCIGGSDWEASYTAHPSLSSVTYLWSIDGGTYHQWHGTYYINQWTNPSVTIDFKIQTSCGTSSPLGGWTFYSPCPGFRAILSPNPAKDHVMITIEEKPTGKRPLKNDPLEVRIYNFDNSSLLGTQKALKGSKQLRLNTRTLNPGKYLLHIKYNGETVVQQILIQ